jgi:hypothetical protein
MQGMDHSNMAGMDHAAMGHAAPAVDGPRTALPAVDYGMGAAMKMGGMNHAGMDRGAMAEESVGGIPTEGLGVEGALDGSGRVFGWASGAPYGSRVLSYADLRSRTPQDDVRPAEREVVLRLSGSMERYIWTLNGAKFGGSRADRAPLRRTGEDDLRERDHDGPPHAPARDVHAARERPAR